MFFFSIFVAIIGLFETSLTVALLSLTGSRDVFPVHPSNSTLLNRIKLFPPSRNLWKNNDFGAASTSNSCAGPAYPNVYACWIDNEEDCLETCQKVTQEGMPSYVTNIFKGIIESLRVVFF